MTDQPEYPLGMEPAEIVRLERQHSLWHDATAKVWELAGFSAGQTIIDLGSGPGFATLDLAGVVGASGRVIAVDSSAEAQAQCRWLAQDRGLDNVEVHPADVTRFDPSPWHADGVFARWLFSYLSDPAAVIRSLAGALPLGATVAVMDYWNYLSIRTEPQSSLFAKVYRAVYDSVGDAGGSFDIAGRLPALFAASGLKVTAVESFSRVGLPGSPLWTWLNEFQRLYLPTLVAKSYLSAGELQEYWHWWDGLEGNPGALLFAPPVLGVVGVKGA